MLTLTQTRKDKLSSSLERIPQWSKQFSKRKWLQILGLQRSTIPDIYGAAGMLSRLYHALKTTEGWRVLITTQVHDKLNLWQNLLCSLVDRFKEDTGLGETQIGRFLGPSHKVGSLMSNWILTASGIPVSRTTVHCVTYLETCTDARNQRFEVYDKAIKDIFHEKYTEEAFASPNSTNLTMEMWTELVEDNKDFQLLLPYWVSHATNQGDKVTRLPMRLHAVESCNTKK